MEMRTKLNILVSTLLKKKLQSVVLHYFLPFLIVFLLQDNHFQIPWSSGMCFYLFFLAVWSFQMLLYIYMLFHKTPFSWFVLWLKELDAESFPRLCQLPLDALFVKGSCLLEPIWVPQCFHIGGTQDVFAELTRQHPAKNLWNEYSCTLASKVIKFFILIVLPKIVFL